MNAIKLNSNVIQIKNHEFIDKDKIGENKIDGIIKIKIKLG